MENKRILIVDDDLSYLNMLQVFLQKNDFQTVAFTQAKQAFTALSSQRFDLVLTDYRMPGMDGMDFLQKIKEENIHLPVVMMTSYGEIQLAVKAMQLGAANYLTKPVDAHELLQLIKHLLQGTTGSEGLKKKPIPKQKPSAETKSFGIDPIWNELKKRMDRLARSDLSVLIRGESGVGKEFIAQWIHQQSLRKEGPFVAVDCGSLTDELFASALFGHVKGSFTGASDDKTGFLQAANGGTLFLDEVGNLSLAAQMLLLRSLQERSFRKVGGTTELKSDFRILAATNASLEVDMESGRFRSDLFHRLNEVDVHIPALRERKEDILFFAQAFATSAAEELQLPFHSFTPSAQAALHQYHWPGNLRELKNVVKKSILFSNNAILDLANLPNELRHFPKGQENEQITSLEQREKEAIIEALREAGNNKSRAAEHLQIDRKTLYNKLKRYGLS